MPDFYFSSNPLKSSDTRLVIVSPTSITNRASSRSCDLFGLRVAIHKPRTIVCIHNSHSSSLSSTNGISVVISSQSTSCINFNIKVPTEIDRVFQFVSRIATITSFYIITIHSSSINERGSSRKDKPSSSHLIKGIIIFYCCNVIIPSFIPLIIKNIRAIYFPVISCMQYSIHI